MLSQLIIRNFALIDDLSLELLPGLNVLTGETGAGKSILIDALQLVLGERCDAQKIRDKSRACFIQAAFSVSEEFLKKGECLAPFLKDGDDYLILRREITAEGKSKASINDQMVNLSTLKEIGQYLVDVHGQHDHQRIFNPASHLELVDRYAHGMPPHAKYQNNLDAYNRLYRDYEELQRQKHEILSQQQDKDREIDLLTYQVNEIERCKPQEGEDQTLEAERIRLAHAEKLHEITARILSAFDEGDSSISNQLGKTFRDWTEWSRIDESIRPLQTEVQNLQAGIEEMIRSVRDYQEGLSFDSSRLEDIQQRLDALAMIKKKYGGCLTVALDFLKEAKRKLDLLVNSEVRERDIDQKLGLMMPEIQRTADELTGIRKKAMTQLGKAVEDELKDLAIRHAKFECLHEKTEFGPWGRDRIEFMLSPNAGEPMRPLIQIASGGEASRIMLAIKRTLARADMVPTLIFDEIDANIGGRLGEKVGRKVKDIASERQVVLITHLPQIASFADNHIKVLKKVERQKTYVTYQNLKGDERIQELAQMMSGDRESSISLEHAREMIKTAVE
ncbi:MAG: DNA repair protein RecN [Candidatus Omnitrophica bacterium]|nr:DNA repair protein RecN [Candidatus Omnitrophota bacterium]